MRILIRQRRTPQPNLSSVSSLQILSARGHIRAFTKSLDARSFADASSSRIATLIVVISSTVVCSRANAKLTANFAKTIRSPVDLIYFFTGAKGFKISSSTSFSPFTRSRYGYRCPPW